MSASPLARATTLACALAVPLVIAAAAAAPAWGDALAEDAVTAAPELGVSAGEAERRLRRQEDVGAAGAEARRRWPGSFAGIWTDHAAGGTVVVAFTSDAAGRAAALGRGRTDRAVTVARSLGELERRQGAMIADRELARNGFLLLPGAAGGRYDLDIDVRRNALVVTLEDASPGVAAAFRARYGDDVIVESGPLGAPECTRSDCRYDLRSGLQVTSEDWICSSAFTVRRDDNGNRNLLSAGHCSQDNRHHGGQRYGEVVAQQESGRVDAERHSVSANGFAAKPWIFVDVDHKSRDVLSRGSYSGIAVGDEVCKSGQTTGKSCGSVTSKNYSPSWIPNGNDFIKTTYCAKGGDSGAGVYIGNKALGVHSGGAQGACSDPGDFSAFSHIEFVQNALNATVVLAG